LSYFYHDTPYQIVDFWPKVATFLKIDTQTARFSAKYGNKNDHSARNIRGMSTETAAQVNSALEELPTTADALFGILEGLDVPTRLYHHQPVFTVGESLEIERDMPGAHCRNLFVRDKKGTMFLVVAQNETLIDLKKLSDLLGCGRLSFGSPERLWTYLGVRPGSVCPFAIINDKDNAVTIVLDQLMMGADIVNYHPMENHMTIGLKPEDLIKFIRYADHEPLILDLTPAKPDAKLDESETQ